MQSTLLKEKNKKSYMQNFLKNVIKINNESKTYRPLSNTELNMNEQLSTHKLKTESAVFASKTNRKLKVAQNPGPGHYNTNYEHKYLKNNPEGFGSTTTRSNLVIRNAIESPFTDPTSMSTPGVGIYNKDKKYFVVDKSRNLLRKTNLNAREYYT